MNLEEAFEIILNEAESVGLGESGDTQEKILMAVEVAQVFYEEYGYQFSNFSVDSMGEDDSNVISFSFARFLCGAVGNILIYSSRILGFVESLTTSQACAAKSELAVAVLAAED